MKNNILKTIIYTMLGIGINVSIFLLLVLYYQIAKAYTIPTLIFTILILGFIVGKVFQKSR